MSVFALVIVGCSGAFVGSLVLLFGLVRFSCATDPFEVVGPWPEEWAWDHSMACSECGRVCWDGDWALVDGRVLCVARCAQELAA